MFRSIFQSRRVNKARKRLVSSVSSDAMTIPGISFTGLEVRCTDQNNLALDISDEYVYEELPAVFFDHSAGNSNVLSEVQLARHGLPVVGTKLSPDSYQSLPNQKESNDRRNVFVEFPLPQIIRLLVKIMEPDSVFALDTLLQSTSAPDTEVAISTRIVSDCVFLAHFYYSYYSARSALFGFTIPQIRPLSVSSNCTGHHHQASKRQLPRTGKASSSSAFSDCDVFQIGIDRVRSKTLKLLNSLDPLKTCAVPIQDTALFCVDPLFAVCKAWRWPDLRPGEWVRRLPVCRATTTRPDHSARLCINPHHWSRVLIPDNSSSSPGAPASGFDLRLADEPDVFRVGISTMRRRSSTCLVSFTRPITIDERSQSLVPDAPEDFSSEPQSAFNQPSRPHPSLSTTDSISTDCEETSLLLPEYKPTCSEHLRSTLPMKPGCRNNTPLFSAPPSDWPSYSTSGSTGSTDLSTVAYGTQRFQTCTCSCNSSTSTSATEDSGPRTRAKKPRPSESTDSCVEHVPPPRSNSERCWAHLSYWEGNRHVAQSWYKLNDPVVYVVYDYDTSRNQSGNRVRQRNGVRRSIGMTYIRLSTLVHRTKVEIPRTLPIDVSMLPQCITCNQVSISQANSNPVSPSGREDGLYHETRISDRSTSWRQCYRLGNQGLVLTLTSQGRVWLANQTLLSSNLPIFVSSSCLSSDNKTGGSSIPWLVRRVPAGYSIIVFDLVLYRNHLALSSRDSMVHLPNGKTNTIQQSQPPVPVVHISLGKGWGPSYRRPDFTHCPARLELWINVDQLPAVGAVS